MNAPNLQDASFPHEVASLLRGIANTYNEAASELQSAWQDPQAGKVWEDFARILNRAAASCELACTKRGV